jgi:hypothetical protein
VVLPKIENEIEMAEIVSKIYKGLGIEDPIELQVISKEEFEKLVFKVY